jgi:hypothetical protein
MIVALCRAMFNTSPTNSAGKSYSISHDTSGRRPAPAASGVEPSAAHPASQAKTMYDEKTIGLGWTTLSRQNSDKTAETGTCNVPPTFTKSLNIGLHLQTLA